MFSVASHRFNSRSLTSALAAVIMSSTALTPVRSFADDLPTNGSVTAGSADIVSNGSGMQINQSSKNVIIQWDGFSVGSGKSVNFQNGSGATLNRVTGTDISRIDGSLSATGSLFLINKNGVVVGKDGVIQTGGKFVASTLDVKDSDFLDEGDMTFSGDSSAFVINKGKIGSLGGDVAIIARNIVNEGELDAPNGTVGLAAGREVLLRDADLDSGKFLVKIGAADSSITEAGLIKAANVELRANGGNIYALAGNKGGAINATGVAKSGGRIFLTAGGGRVHVAKAVRASRGNDGGNIFINAKEVTVSGLLQADGNGGAGGNIDIGGNDIALTGATIDASGTTAGGRIRVGGEYQGGKNLTTDEVQNARLLTVDAASTLTADGTGYDANGGTVIAWADDTTTFNGKISATGGANGGSAEVSGKSVLNYAGRADLRGATGTTGTLLLDPTDFTIDAAEASTIVSNLATSNVVVSTASTGAGNGDIFVNSTVTYDSGNSLILLAHRNIEANASIQNSGSGDLNLIAGWDGTTDAPGAAGINSPASINLADFTTGTYGNSSGSVIIGDSTQTSGIAVGTNGGTTTVLASNLTLSGGSSAGYSQLGYHGAATGAIGVWLTGDLMLGGGSTSGAYAQVGHGAADGSNSGNVGGNISIVADGMTALTDNSSTAWLGHYTKGSLSNAGFTLISNGLDFSGTNGLAPMVLNNIRGGDVTIVDTMDQTSTNEYDKIIYDYTGKRYLSYWANTDNNLTFVSKGGIFFNCGYQAVGTGANIDLVSGWDGSTGLDKGTAPGVDVSVIEASSAYGTSSVLNQGNVNIGNGSQSRDIPVGTRTGDATVLAYDLQVMGSNSSYFQAQLGANPYEGDINNAIRVIAKNDVLVVGGSHDYASARIGNSGIETSNNLAGNIDITAGNGILVTAGDGVEAYAQIGHSIYYGDGKLSGNIRLAAQSLSVEGGGNDGSYAEVGHGGNYVSSQISGDITANISGMLALAGGSGSDAYAQLGHFSDSNGASSGSVSGAIDLSGSTLEVSGGSGNYAEAQIGHYGYNGSTGGILLDFAGNISILGGSGDYTAAYVGHSGTGDASAAIDVRAGGSLILKGGSYGDTEAQIGHQATDGTLSGDINVSASGSISVLGGSGYANYAMIGHGYFDNSFTAIGGAISVTSGGDVAVSGGSDQGSYAQIGHGGDFVIAPLTGNITVDAAGSVAVAGGAGDYASARIGLGGFRQEGDRTGNIEVTSHGVNNQLPYAGILVSGFAGGTGSVAQIGNGGVAVTGVSMGTITLNALGSGDFGGIAATGGSSDGTYALIGHGGVGSDGTFSGDINISANGNILLSGGSGTAIDTFAMIGHGDASSSSTGDRMGNISADVGGEFTIEDGSGTNATAWVGHQTSSGTVSNANVFLQAFAFDRSSSTSVASGALGDFSKNIIASDITGGSFTLVATGTGLELRDPVYNSPNQLLISVNNDLVLANSATYTNNGTGDIIFAAGGDFHNDSGSLMPIVTGGRWLVYSTRPDNNRNDIEITNRDFLRYSTSFNINDPIPSSFPSGNGLIYSVTPVIKLAASDETITYGDIPSPTVTRGIEVNGTAANAAEFGFSIDPSSPDFSYASNVLFDGQGYASVGFYAGGLVPSGYIQNYYGVTIDSNAGNLTVNAVPVTVPPVVTPPVTTPPVVTPTGPQVDNTKLSPCSPSEDDLDKAPYNSNTGQICTILPKSS